MELNFIGETLPAGIHEITLEEFEKKFVYNLKRKEIFSGLNNLLSDLRTIGCKAVYIDGSFVTKKELPRDVDVCWDNSGINLGDINFLLPILSCDQTSRIEQNRKYKADVFPAFVMEYSSKKLFIDFFQIDKYTGLPKGIIKINL